MSGKSRPTVVITGANGFLGSALVDYFLQQKWQVVGLVRRPSAHTLRPGLRYVAYDIGKAVDKDAFEGADYLIHAAFVKQDSHHPNAMELNIAAAERLLQVSRAARLKKNIFISSMAAHEGALSVYGRQKLAIEKLFDTSRDLSLRPGLIVGNGGIVKSMADFMRTKHVVPLIAGGRQPLQVVAVYDIVAAVAAGLTLPVHGLLTIATPTVYSYRLFYVALQQHLKTWVIFLPLPYVMLQAALKLVGWLRLPLAVSEDNLLGLKKLQSVDTAADLDTLGLALDELGTMLAQTSLS
jgi:nucleoside-diphosphate-sugar epimerase